MLCRVGHFLFFFLFIFFHFCFICFSVGWGRWRWWRWWEGWWVSILSVSDVLDSLPWRRINRVVSWPAGLLLIATVSYWHSTRNGNEKCKKKTPTNQQTKNLISLSLSLFLSFYFFISSSLDRKRSVGLKLKKKINRSFRSDFCCLFLERHATFRY